MLWLALSCVLGYEQDGKLTTISVEQTRSAHYFYYDKAIQSSLRIEALNEEGESIGHASGNYFKIGMHKFIISAAHVTDDVHSNVFYDYKNEIKLNLVYIDETMDIAIFVPEKKIKSVKAVDYRTAKELDLTGVSVVYAGYPADLEKAVFNGTIATCAAVSFMMQSFALPGASGSVVFNNKGQAVGVLSAIKIGYHGYSPYPQIHPGLVYVNRLRMYDRFKVEELIVSWKKLK